MIGQQYGLAPTLWPLQRRKQDIFRSATTIEQLIRQAMTPHVGALFGAQDGYKIKKADGSLETIVKQVTWDKKLTMEFQTVALPLKFPEDALAGNVWLGFYRSNRKGTLYLDNVRSMREGEIDDEQAAELRRMHRDWGHLATAASEVAGRPDADKQARQIADHARGFLGHIVVASDHHKHVGRVAGWPLFKSRLGLRRGLFFARRRTYRQVCQCA